MSIIQPGQLAPDICLPDAAAQPTRLSQFHGQWVIVYFYCKDDTPSCMMEATDFTAFLPQLRLLNAVALGISPDSSAKHARAVAKYKIEIPLLSDMEHTAATQFGVWQRKKLYGLEYDGIVRSTFLIDPTGQIVAAWERIRVKGHAEKVIKRLSEVQS